MDAPTPYVESNALLAALDGDEDAVQEILEQMLPGELARLADAAGLLASMARYESRRPRRPQ